MATIVYDCPHCDAKIMSFAIQSEYIRPANPQQLIVSATCGGCNMPITVLFHSAASLIMLGYKTADYSGNLMATGHQVRAHKVFPESTSSEAPADIPDSVARVFSQAAASLKGQHFDAACSMYRKAMELALKAFSPDIEAWKIEKRIDRLAKENRITPEIQAWAHELRLDGNEAVHSDTVATVEMASQMHEFCKFLLIYLYTLPAQVEAAKLRREEGQ
ncbi:MULTISPECIES: DUF4145 domain-containing protein [unclassified Janthinobacterium]|uniref:DUF4145 domain-containing protein n=1 Tax=unclassified Janthinobacterium TaxID=2610881 RepID=UPI00185691BC|nr:MULTISPECIES: DUF4145 domain-containing protein [unclassified Janthinobacterium]MBB5610407.1 hypothetical protein [Janthinobacterium sp. S3T4]MBB5615756.1 hypothetical protein [Janthinobacterium sp. S3M3]